MSFLPHSLCAMLKSCHAALLFQLAPDQTSVLLLSSKQRDPLCFSKVVTSVFTVTECTLFTAHHSLCTEHLFCSTLLASDRRNSQLISHVPEHLSTFPLKQSTQDCLFKNTVVVCFLFSLNIHVLDRCCQGVILEIKI